MLYKANCDQCSYEAEFVDQLRSYEVLDGSTVWIEQAFVWCDACREVRWGEKVPDLAELERKLASTRARDPKLVDFFLSLDSKYETLDEQIARRIAELESQIAWRRRRVSPPRCLECGSTEIIPLERL